MEDCDPDVDHDFNVYWDGIGGNELRGRVNGTQMPSGGLVCVYYGTQMTQIKQMTADLFMADASSRHPERSRRVSECLHVISSLSRDPSTSVGMT